MEADALRTSLSFTLRRCESPCLIKLGETVATHACWGLLVEALEQLCTEDADYLALLDILVGLDDPRALILFMSAARTRVSVLGTMLERAGELPRAVQCALVTLPECEALTERLSPDACAAAQELAADSAKRRASEPVYQAHIGALRSMRWGGHSGASK